LLAGFAKKENFDMRQSMFSALGYAVLQIARHNSVLAFPLMWLSVFV